MKTFPRTAVLAVGRCMVACWFFSAMVSSGQAPYAAAVRVPLLRFAQSASSSTEPDPSSPAATATSSTNSDGSSSPDATNAAADGQTAAPADGAPDAAPAGPPPTPPATPDGFAGSAEVNTTAGRHAAGVASVVRFYDQPQAYILSVRHLLGPAGGFEKDVAAADVPAFVKSVRFDAFKGTGRAYAVTALLIKSSRLAPVGGAPLDDLAIYRLRDPGAQDQAVPLADKLPATGETVFLVARLGGNVSQDQFVHSMKVVNTKTWLECVFDNDSIVTSSASGAPVLNAGGECIGVYSAHSKIDGHMHAFMIPSPQIISAIKGAPPPR